MMPIRLAIVDDHPLFREGVARSLSDVGFEIVGEGSSRDEAIAISSAARVRFTASAPPDVLMRVSYAVKSSGFVSA